MTAWWSSLTRFERAWAMSLVIAALVLAALTLPDPAELVAIIVLVVANGVHVAYQMLQDLRETRR